MTVSAREIKQGYRPQAEDTSLETDWFYFNLLRQRSHSDRLQMAAALTRNARELSLCGLRQSFSALAPPEFALKVARTWLGDRFPEGFVPTGDEMTWIQDSIGLAIQLHQLFERLHIEYYVTGGIAAVTYGEPRLTQDVDIVLNLTPQDIDLLVAALESAGFYVPGVEEVKSGRMRTLGITHQETIARADLVLAHSERFDALKFERRRLIEIPQRGAIYLASAEDLILNKLRWRRQSQSEKQWRDVLGILKTQGEKLDFGYLATWAEQLQVDDDLAQAFVEAGL